MLVQMRPSEKVRPGMLELCGKWDGSGGGFNLPFRGALVTGGVEADSPQYWVGWDGVNFCALGVCGQHWSQH